MMAIVSWNSLKFGVGLPSEAMAEASERLERLNAVNYVIASVSEAINKQGIPRKSARKAMAKPQHSRALKITIP